MGMKLRKAAKGERSVFSYHGNITDWVMSGAEIGVPQNRSCSNDRDIHADAGKENLLQLSLSIAVLQEIGRRCSSKVSLIWILFL